MITPKFSPGDMITNSTPGFVHIIWAVCKDNYYYELFYKGRFKEYMEFPIEDYEGYDNKLLSKLERALM